MLMIRVNGIGHKMNDYPIKGNGTKKLEINMGILNCIGEPYAIEVDGKKLILRFKQTGKDGDYGKISLESAL